MRNLIESNSLSKRNIERLHEEEEEKNADDFDQISGDPDLDDDFDGEDIEGGDNDADDLDFEGFDDKDFLLDDEEVVSPEDGDMDFEDGVDDFAGEGHAPTASGSYDCDAIAGAVQDVINSISATKGLSVKSFIGSVEVDGYKVDFRVKTTDGEITGITVDNIVPLQQVQDAEVAMDSINDILAGEPENDEDFGFDDEEIEDDADEITESWRF